ncbi:MAG: hypothetical protein ACUVRM_00050 [Bacillota bacterium]
MDKNNGSPVQTKIVPSIVGLLLVVGLFFPTSRASIIVTEYSIIAGMFLAFLLGLLFLRPGGRNRAHTILNSAFLLGIILLATLFSPCQAFSYGSLLYYSLLALLYCINLRDIPLTSGLQILFRLVSLTSLAILTLIVLDWQPIDKFIINNYSYFYNELVVNMLNPKNNIPILSFTNHSAAAFFFYLFFVLNFRSFQLQPRKRWFDLIIASAFIPFMIRLQCVTSYLLVVLAFFQIILYFIKVFQTNSILISLLMAFLAMTPFLSFYEMTKKVITILKVPSKGFLGRYSSMGVLAEEIRYISTHPLRPIGLGFSRFFLYGDSGLVDCLLRGSFPLLLSVYAGLFFFFHENLRSRREAFAVFLLFTLFELGFCNLVYLRTLYFLPFLVVHLNGVKPFQGEMNQNA